MTGSLGECFEATACFGKEFLVHCQVALRPRQVLVAKVGRQLGQEIVQVRPATIPRGDTMDGCGMPKIVHAGLVASATVSLHASNRTQALEGSAECGIGQIRAIAL